MQLAAQFLGAVGILLPYVLLQIGRLSQRAYAYLVPNLVGSGILTGIAYLEGQWGFVILQAVWTLAAAWGIVRRVRVRPPVEHF